MGCNDQRSSQVPATPTASASATAIQAQVVKVVNDVSPEAVQMRCGPSLGSGVVYDPRGDVVTNLHVLGLRSSVTEGIVSSVNRSVAESQNVDLAALIQTSAEINPGNSGGALVDLSGRVIGIPTLTALDPEFADSQAPGIGFAIPSDVVKSVASSLIESN
jgi:S1-C subfamily serine protease